MVVERERKKARESVVEVESELFQVTQIVV
jgi:hypothetical protein